MDSRLHGNDGKRAPDGKKPPRKEGDRKEKERGHSCPLPLVPSEKMEIGKKERERRARYPNATAATAAATTGGQECPPPLPAPLPLQLKAVLVIGGGTLAAGTFQIQLHARR